MIKKKNLKDGVKKLPNEWVNRFNMNGKIFAGKLGIKDNIGQNIKK